MILAEAIEASIVATIFILSYFFVKKLSKRFYLQETVSKLFSYQIY